MTAAAALIRASWRAALTYRLQLVLSLGYLLATVVPIYFVAGALQPTMSDAIQYEGGQFFGFLIVGMAAFSFVTVAVNGLAAAIDSGIRTGTFEALLGTPARMSSILTGLTGYEFSWTALRGLVYLAAASVLGATLVWSRLPAAALILLMIVLAYVPFGVIAASSVLAFRTAGPLPTMVIVGSGLLGGVYYPTHVIPSWLEYVSAAVPLSYGLRALRRVLLEEQSTAPLWPDLGILALFIIGLFAISLVAFAMALRYARRNGTLAQY